MKIKTIKKVITAKLNEWLETITDVQLRNEVKTELLVSGGSIASMLQREPVNDFDIYIQDIAVLVRLARYYSKGTQVFDGRLRDHYLDEYFPDRESLQEEFKGEYASYDFVRINNLKPDQVKIDVQPEGRRFEYTDEEAEKQPYRVLFLSQNAISLSDDIQIVTRFSGSHLAIHKNFDFIHATNYFTFKDGLVTNIAALQSILTKELIYQGSLFPITSVIRMKKFLGRGFTINAGQILKMCMQISDLDLCDPNVLEEQLIGVDIAYFGRLIEILRDTTPNSEKGFTTAYINEIIDRVFQQLDDDLFENTKTPE